VSDPALVVDFSVIAELRALGDPGEDMAAEIIAVFLAHAPEQLLALRQAFDAGDAPAVDRVAHRLRGSALGVGARQLAAILAAIEAAARAGDLAGAASSAAMLPPAFESARTALEREASQAGS
jgi:HPt (histidine-containing phosphotransfer) domain-containing protein